MNVSIQIGTEFRTAGRLSAIGISEILKITGLASTLKAEGEDIIILGAGEPDFDTPDHIKEAAARAIRAGATKYTALDGTPELKSAIREKFRRDNHLDYALDEITVSTGAKQVLFNAMMATLDPGDEVVIPTPFWVSYADIVQIRDALRRISTASINLRANPTGGTLSLAILPMFGTRWLAPRLPDFLRRHPVNEDPLLLRQLPLLHIISRPDAWEHWFAASGVSPEGVTGMLFDQFATMAQAAKSGLGVALLPTFLIEREITEGELVPMIDRPMQSRYDYHLVWPHERERYLPLVAFRDWIGSAASAFPQIPS